MKLIRREKNNLWINGVDVLDGTPLLDIKPYVGQFDIRESVRCGWLDEATRRATGMEEYTPAGLVPPAWKKTGG